MDGDMIGPGGVRRFAARWTIAADLVADAPIHLGSGEEGTVVDLPLIRDPTEARPLIMGTSFAGALRDYACERLLGDRVLEDGIGLAVEIERLFGGRRGDPEGLQSPLVVFDALGASPGSGTEIRDGVRIDPRSGTAAEHFKYDLELWPPGTTFRMRLDLQVPEGVSPVDEARLLALLTIATDGLTTGAIRLGARGNRGLGRCRLKNPQAVRYSLADCNGWFRWLGAWLDEPRLPTKEDRGANEIAGALTAAWPNGRQALDAALEAWRKTMPERLVVTVPIRFPAGLLIRSPQETATGADVRHLRSAGNPVLSGTAVAGPLRQRALRIARAVKNGEGDAWAEVLFGSEAQLRRANSALLASRLQVDEMPLRCHTDLQVTRIKLDRFTQAPVGGALFEEEPVYRAKTGLRLVLRLPADAPTADALCGLLLLIVKDLLLGAIPLGGTTGVGRGAVRPDGPLLVERTGREPFEISPTEPPPHSVRAPVEAWVGAFRTHRLAAKDRE